uniref:Thrombospondin-like N-terminal domain-containing protein n=1 Tax=Periophthalmus magnuspinnatus TaxID=409849 RepID=A0A3B4AQJ5_9GOBI
EEDCNICNFLFVTIQIAVFLSVTQTYILMNLVDVLKVLELSEDMEGVSLEAGLCTSRSDQDVTDLSYKIDKKIQLSAPTKQLFPGETPFPVDFSVMTTVRPVKGSQVFLFSLYDPQGTQQLGVELARSPVFLYEDHNGQPSPDMYPIFRKVSLADGKWHRVAYSVEGQSVTLYLDCVKVETLELLRGPDPHVSTEGVSVFGTRLLDEAVFEVRQIHTCLCPWVWYKMTSVSLSRAAISTS